MGSTVRLAQFSALEPGETMFHQRCPDAQPKTGKGDMQM
eukprot:CAMPEP_0171096056 /NCGR_PEP_ID=MMETSP0766_2-20121228/43531_1 /TAXON_ID=439317 /ORGANISM="Gambierdiscus australes, Strain CAWD 149" /LENGTH=38 /DNA_ID= /DNA_START= /DNA_END= /DNA_ORIENTATION=